MISSKKALLLLRITLGTVFIWFGGLKAINMSPVREIVMNSAPDFLDSIPGFFFLLGFVEVLIGAGFLINKWTKVSAVAMMLHLTIASLLVLISNGFAPFFPLLTMEGEFVVKNTVLMAAALLFLSDFAENSHNHHSTHRDGSFSRKIKKLFSVFSAKKL